MDIHWYIHLPTGAAVRELRDVVPVGLLVIEDVVLGVGDDTFALDPLRRICGRGQARSGTPIE